MSSAALTVPYLLAVFVIISPLVSPQGQLPTTIGLIPWRNISDYNMSSWSDLLPLTVEALPIATSKSPYAHIENSLQTIGSKNLLAIVGLYEEAVRLATEELHIPYLALTPVTSKPRDYTLELLPTLDQIGAAVYDLANAYDWSKVSVFYDDDRGVKIMEKLMTNYTLTIRGWRLPDVASEREVKKCLVEMRKVLVEQSVVLCNLHNTRRILDQARTLAMLSTPPYQWLFYDPADDLHDLLLQFPDIAVNFTVLSLTSFNSPPPTAT
ncbi:uncharacterized protein LOC112560016 [Pomacea canaliculata]|uniref:uncharacterized protein LOC112560016 n=1 Tax=Pomacea canaliculata TaxID=400727 RepID=UPI000D730CA1|nr:uncharacterized protein LOC112560016 [Pomacea canaliculata]